MKKILELLFCLVALITLLISTQYVDDVDNVQNGNNVSASENQESVTDNVAMLSDQE
jgi:hypothetical protein